VVVVAPSVTNPNITVSVRATAAICHGSDLATATIPGFSSDAGGFFHREFRHPANTHRRHPIRVSAAPFATPAGDLCVRISAAQPLTLMRGPAWTSANSGGIWNQNEDVASRLIADRLCDRRRSVSSLKDANPGVSALPTDHLVVERHDSGEHNAQVSGSWQPCPLRTLQLRRSDGTVRTFLYHERPALSQFNGLRYLKYKAFLSTTNQLLLHQP